MSAPRLLAALGLLLGASPARLLADVPQWQVRLDWQKWQVTLDWQIVQAPASLALRILPALQDPARADAAREELQKQIATGTAEILAQPRFPLHPEATATSWSYLEHLYAVEYSQPYMGWKPFTNQNFSNVFGLATALPSTFETRNLGEQFAATGEVQPDGRSVAVEVDLRRCVLAGTRPFSGGLTAGGVKGNVDQPRFQVRTLHCALTLPSGRWQYLSAYPSPTGGPCEFFFLRAKIKPFPAPTPAAPKTP